MVLFAGQSFDTQGSKADSVLESLMKRLGIDQRAPRWPAVLERSMVVGDMVWLSERFNRFVPSEGALAAYELPWSAVFTSSVDPNFARRFETRGRQPESVLSAGTYSRVPRSRSRPPIHYVLGRSGAETPDAAAPTNKASLKRRIALHATELLNRIPETTTSRGVVVVAGLDPTNDWLDVDELLAPISERPGIKIVWFGCIDPGKSDFAAELISNGVLQLDPDSLATAVAVVGAPWAQFAESATPDEPSMVTLAGGVLDLTPAVRLRVEASAAVVDDGWTAEIESVEGAAAEESFRRFHGDLAGFRGRVEGIARGFAFRRAFEKHLSRTLEATLSRLSQSDAVILVHGQSGTGKSIALARLVWEVRVRLKLPVLVANTRIPAHADLDAFCAEAERAGAVATILICDTNQPLRRYVDLASALRSRGRRLLIVGTSYRVEAYAQDSSSNYVEAPAALAQHEVTELRELISKFTPDLRLALPAVEDGNALAMLYRTLSHSREHIRSRVNAEARSAESDLRQRASCAPRSERLSQLAEQLIATGIANPETQLFEENANAAALGLDAAGRLIDYVMAPGRLNCRVPLNLIMRMLVSETGALAIDQIVHLFAHLDLFRWHTTQEGSDLLISPRLQLEAELICRSRLGDVAIEIDRLVELIGGVQTSGVDREVERSFLLDLLQKLDRDGPRGDAYRDGYLKFAQALTRLRTERGVLEGPLMMRESLFRRQAIWAQDGDTVRTILDDDRRLTILDEARAIVEEAVRLIDIGSLNASKRTRQNLVSERASIYGYLAVQRSRLNDTDGAWSDYLAAKAASARAIAQTDDYHPVDVSLWTSLDILRTSELSPERRAEVVADLYAGLDIVDVAGLGNDQLVRYYDRKSKIAETIADANLLESAIVALESVAPAAAAFLVTRRMSEPLDQVTGAYDSDQRRIAAEAAAYLSSRSSEVIDDARCARLLLRLRWAEATGQRLLQGERGHTPAVSAQVGNLLEIIAGLNERAGVTIRNSERYLEAVLTWLARDFSKAIEIWKGLSRDSEFEDRSRVIRRLLASDASGAPLKFRGRVEGTKGGADWKVRVEGINTSISLLAHEFKDHDLAHGRELRDFGIAFNYVGPIADPLTRSAARR